MGILILVDQSLLFFTGKAMFRYYNDAPLWVKYILKPLCSCPYCVSWTWGTVAIVILGYEYSFLEWSLLVVCTSFVNYLLYGFLDD